LYELAKYYLRKTVPLVIIMSAQASALSASSAAVKRVSSARLTNVSLRALMQQLDIHLPATV
jgi:hypothetical protein